MTLDIIVPHYKEPWETCRYLFDSIAMQRGIPFDLIKVIVVNDGDECVLEIPKYPYEVKYIVKQHEGVSAARNCGLDQSDADYVMFCDIDDGFLSNYGLHLVFSAMQDGTDFIYSNFIEETYDKNGNQTITSHNKDLTFMHGKVYRRQFLIEKDLWFDPDMTIHEDGYFNMVAYVTAKNEGTMKCIETPFYIWCWNNNSVVRSDKKDFVLKTYPDVLKTRHGISEQLKKRGYEEDFVVATIMTVLNCYYDFQKPAWSRAENARYVRIAEKEFKAYWQKYKDVFNNCTNEKISNAAIAARQVALGNGFLLEKESLKEFLKRVG